MAASAPSVRHGVVTSDHPSSKSVMLAPPTVRVLAQQPMQEHAPTRASQPPPPCLQQVQVSKSGALLLTQSRCIRSASPQPREAAVVPIVGLPSDHHHRVLGVCGVQVNAPFLSSTWAKVDDSCCTARAHSTTRSVSWPGLAQKHASEQLTAYATWPPAAFRPVWAPGWACAVGWQEGL